MMQFQTRLILLICLSIQQHVHAKEVIVIGADHNPPFRLIENGVYKGIYGEMIHEIVKDMNLEVKTRVVSFNRSLLELKQGKIDVFLALVKRPERAKYLHYCEPFIKNRTDRAFYLRPGEGGRIQKYNDLYGLELGMLRGVKLTTRLDHDDKLSKQPVTTHEQNFKKLLAGRIDAFVHTEIAIDFQIKALGYQKKIEKAPFRLTHIQPTYFVVSKQSRYMDRIPAFEKNLRRIYENDLFWKLVKKWNGIEKEEKEDR